MKDNFQQAVIDELVVAGIYQNEHESNAKLAVKDLLMYHCEIAVDVRVSKPASDIRKNTLVECKELFENEHVLLALPKIEKAIEEIDAPIGEWNGTNCD